MKFMPGDYMLDDIVYTKQPMDKIKTVFHRGYEICIYPDEQPMEDPNDWDDEYGFLIHDHRDFSTAPSGLDPSDAQDIFNDYASGKITYVIGKVRYWIFPVYAYIHGGVKLYLSKISANRFEPTGFDTSFKGFVLINKNKPALWSFDEALKAAHDIIDIWNQYLNGEVYGYTSPEGSCWGYYGDEGMKQAIEEAKSEIDAVLSCKNKERIQRLKKYIKSKVPIQYRKLEPIM